MRIGIDYTAAAWQGAGIGRYTRELVHAIVAQGPQHRYTLFYAAGGLDRRSPYLAGLHELCRRHPYVRAVGIPLPPRRLTQLWHRLRVPLPIEIFTGPIDVLHAPDFVPPPTHAGRVLVTVHDLSFRVHPECAYPSVRRYLEAAVPRAVRRAHVVLADSRATRDDLVRLLAVPTDKITVVYPGVAARFRPMDAAELVGARARLGLPNDFLLFVGTLEPRKNLPRLVAAYAQLVATDARFATLPLILGGRRGWMYEPTLAAIAEHGMQERIRLIDFIADDDLPIVYNLSRAFIYPSIYEGFGLPVVEALACGVPVVTCDNSSLPEVAGAAALLVPANDTTALARAIAAAAWDPAVRARARQLGPVQAAAFSWASAAQDVRDLYQRAG